MKDSYTINNFTNEVICIYKDERYSVRDNVAVMRHSRDGKKSRAIDNIWTFGKLNNKNGYLEIASVSVHRIVATAFYNEPISKDYVVDHIDTNKQNNRPENLRWVTRLENILLNPITSKRIAVVCGSIEAFLENPAAFREKFQDPNYNWMCTVSIDEAKISLQRLQSWAQNDKTPSGGSLGEWIYKRSLSKEANENTLEFINSLTTNAVQKAQNWRTPTEFPCCPQEKHGNPITIYFKKLKVGDIFCQNQFTIYLVEHFTISKDGNILWIICKSEDANQIKPYTLAEVTFQDDFFVHNSLGTFFQKVGAEKQFTLAQGLEWTDGETFDDLC